MVGRRDKVLHKGMRYVGNTTFKSKVKHEEIKKTRVAKFKVSLGCRALLVDYRRGEARCPPPGTKLAGINVKTPRYCGQ